ncbi:MAG TPA: substrate-binding domain-containing protein [Bryobacteraceae bacterium]|nr:substrate-binding domain-containing protein [Bryobacteraceae bacterium]
MTEVNSVIRACEILKAFQGEGELLRVRDIAERTGIHKATVSRLLGTLVAAGFMERASQKRYSSSITVRHKRRAKIAYASQAEDSPFAHEVSASIRRAAAMMDVELVFVDNRFSARTAVRNANRLVREGVDIVIEFQTFESVAPLISSIFQQAKIPMIAIGIPHPGATYFGANNYEAGLIAGRALGRWAAQNWDGKVDELILIGLEAAGNLPRLRLTGALEGIREILPKFPEAGVVRLEGNDSFRRSLSVTRAHLRARRSVRALVTGINDACSLGALSAFEEAGIAESCVVVGQGAIREARDEMRKARTRMIGSVAFFPEQYGEESIQVALDILANRPVPPAVFTRHRLITPQNVERYYGNDPITSERSG